MSEEFRDQPGEPETPTPAARGELENWLDWARQMAALVAAVGELARAEGQLALADIKRLLIASLAIIPFLMLTWLSFGVWISWLVYSLSGSPGYAFFVFFALQAVVSLYLRVMIKTYRSTLSLPRTRQHVSEILEEIKRGSSRSDP